MTSEQVSGGSSPGEIVRDRLREVRKARKLNATQAAELYDDPSMTSTVLMNIEAGRRAAGATIDELIRFAYVLDVPPEALLVAAGEHVQVAPGVTVDSARFLRWVRGQEPLEGTDARQYQAAADAVLSGAEQPVSQDLRAWFQERAMAAFDLFAADADQISRKTREQVREVLGEVRDAITSDAPTADVLQKIDGFLDRLGRPSA
ncbi:hypothetical protein Cs7R123_31950 [Catellatospora sp. TT07R-123]|uniref:helix-turn-helix domain-containing protein n=1 Tax=Catellatospora sp. TT07R-123 TaxID=2733863 RepID=UPI001B1AD016|nr:helix-turn-helix transcriptional regulator [Catellatospora sp. TT07R-123]GHJ45853.1 hypothetical protein Cs7R123_31950 [Catellatospora sp. TT07R-123]